MFMVNVSKYTSPMDPMGNNQEFLDSPKELKVSSAPEGRPIFFPKKESWIQTPVSTMAFKGRGELAVGFKGV